MPQGFVLNIKADVDAFISGASRVERDNVPFVTACALDQDGSKTS